MPNTHNSLTESIEKYCQHIEKYEFASDCLVITVKAKYWLETAKILRDDCAMTQLIDLCGVDYGAYGQSNWETDKATNRGFSRGVFDFAEDETAENSNLNEEQRYCVAVHLLDVVNNQRLRVKIYLEEQEFPTLDSVVSIWESANWYEREAFDLFGILFKGHPDLRRILTDYGFVGHPLRKNFPLEGNVEMQYDPEKQQVVYQPVSIENRVNIPRVIRSTEPNIKNSTS